MESYLAVNFDWRALSGDEVAVRCLKADSVACEIAFMAALLNTAVEKAPHDGGSSMTALRLAARFALEHPLCWFDRAVHEMAATGDDFYVYVVRIATQVSAAIAELCDE